jgi:hypothetical protein
MTDSDNDKTYGWSGTLNVSLTSICFAVRNPKNFKETKNFKAVID